jgi:hypothetical protein
MTSVKMIMEYGDNKERAVQITREARSKDAKNNKIWISVAADNMSIDIMEFHMLIDRIEMMGGKPIDEMDYKEIAKIAEELGYKKIN